MIQPPRLIEALLDALGAEPRYRDSVLGDLAEEFASQAECEGVERAREWYRREALRATPHLLRSGWRRARQRGLGHLLGIFVTAFAGLFIVEIVIGGIVFGTLRALGLWHAPLRLSVASPLMQASIIVLGSVTATFGGYIAAWLGNDAPLFTAFAYGIAWSSAEAVGLAITGGMLPLWYRLSVPIVLLVGTTAGGILRVRHGMHDRSGGIESV